MESALIGFISYSKFWEMLYWETCGRSSVTARRRRHRTRVNNWGFIGNYTNYENITAARVRK